MTAAQDGQAERCATCHGILAATCPACHPPVPVPNPDVREAVARWVRGLVALRGGSRLSVEHSAELADELLAVVGQASRADEALDCGCGGTGFRPFDSDGIEACPVHMTLRPAVVQPAQPDDDGLHEWQCPPCGATTRALMADQPGDSGLRQRLEALHDRWADFRTTGLLRATVVDQLRRVLDGGER